MPDTLWTDDDFTADQVSSAPVFSAPLSNLGVDVFYVLTQKFRNLQANFAPLALDTAHPDYPDYVLVREDPQTDLGGTLVDWTRTYCKVPDSFSRPGGSYSYTFPVLLSGLNSTSRFAPFTFTVGCRIQYDFFHTSDPDTITVIEPQRYVLSTSPNTDATSGYGSPVVTATGLFNVIPTVPNYATYSGWVSGGVEIIPEASKIITNWMGNIHMRQTIYIKAH